MNKQEIFDTVAQHLLEQNKKAIGAFGECRYRGKKGTQCAIGALIPDELYDPAIEGTSMLYISTFSDMAKYEILTNILDELGLITQTDLLEELQDIHDFCEPEYWREELKYQAEAFGLDSSVLEA